MRPRSLLQSVVSVVPPPARLSYVAVYFYSLAALPNAEPFHYGLWRVPTFRGLLLLARSALRRMRVVSQRQNVLAFLLAISLALYLYRRHALRSLDGHSGSGRNLQVLIPILERHPIFITGFESIEASDGDRQVERGARFQL